MRYLLPLLLLTVVSSAQAAIQLECGGAHVAVERNENTDRTLDMDATGALVITRAGLGTTLHYRGGIDYIGAACVTSGRGDPLLVFQAYCGGSGCRDLDNWGLIDPRNLRVLLVPGDSNRGEAQRLLGAPLPCLDMLSLSSGKLLNCSSR